MSSGHPFTRFLFDRSLPQGDKTPLAAAASMCNPFDLVLCDRAFETGIMARAADASLRSFGRNPVVFLHKEAPERPGCHRARDADSHNPSLLKLSFSLSLSPAQGSVYSTNMGKGMRRLFAPHEGLFRAESKKFDYRLAAAAKTVRDFDEAITRRSFGFPSVDAYYEYSGSKKRLPGVRIPLVCVQAEDDPIAVKEAIPYEAIRKNENVMLLSTKSGGHLGWVALGEGAPRGAGRGGGKSLQLRAATTRRLSASVSSSFPEPAYLALVRRHCVFLPQARLGCTNPCCSSSKPCWRTGKGSARRRRRRSRSLPPRRRRRGSGRRRCLTRDPARGRVMRGGRRPRQAATAAGRRGSGMRWSGTWREQRQCRLRRQQWTMSMPITDRLPPRRRRLALATAGHMRARIGSHVSHIAARGDDAFWRHADTLSAAHSGHCADWQAAQHC